MTDNRHSDAICDGVDLAIIQRHGRRALFALLDRSEYIQSHHARGEFYEEQLLQVLAERLRPGSLVVDVGANIGNHTIFFAAICECKVLAIEPDAGNFGHLKGNVRLNQLESRVTLVRGAASDSAGNYARVVCRTPGNSGAVSVALTHEDTGIPSVRLDLLDISEAPALIKVDTEGMDLAVLKGATGLLSKYDPIIVVEAGAADEYDAIAGFLRQFTYVCGGAHNPTPTFVFTKQGMEGDTSTLAYDISRSFAHQRIALSAEISRLNLRARELREAYSRTKTDLDSTRQALQDVRSQLDRQTQDANSTRTAFERDRADRGDLLKPLEQQQSLLEQALSRQQEMLRRLEAEQSLVAELRSRERELTTRLESQESSLAEARSRERELSRRLESEAQRVEAVEATLEEKERQLHDWQAKVRQLSADLTKVSADRDRGTANYRAVADRLARIRSSESFQIGHAIIKAFTRPGRNTLLLPWAIGRILLRSRKPKTGNQASTVRPGSTGSGAVGVRGVGSASKAKVTTLPPPAPAVKPDVKGLSELRVACIMDGFSLRSFAPECELLQLTPDNWHEELADFNPHLLFVESAWRGKDELWDKKISHASRELVELIVWCRERGIPTAFWNKEDPVHFQTFMGTAKLFDYVFTTDIDCISGYKTVLGSDRVHLLPFACQPALHNPLELYDRKDAFCFAGAYYARYPERAADLETFTTVLDRIGTVDIYDRNYNWDHPDYMFPEAYKPFIRGHLPPEQIDRAYKGYRYAINLNSIKQSQTMFARRVYELVASNTITLSNYSRGLRLLFGELVVSTDDPLRLQEEVARLADDETYARKLRLAGLRKVLREHTYSDRLAYVAEKALGLPRRDRLPHIAVTACVGSEAELEAVLDSYRRQQYRNRSLVVVLRDGYVPSASPEGDDVRLLDWRSAQSLGLEELAPDGFVAGMVAQDYYGQNYLTDLALATRYSSAPAIGKATRCRYAAGDYEKLGEGQDYRSVETLPLRAAMVRAGAAAARSLAAWADELLDGEVRGIECLSVDEFNYCEGRRGDACPAVDDLDLADTGLAMAELEAAADRVAPEEDCLDVRQLSGKDVRDLIGGSGNGDVTLQVDGERLHIAADVSGHTYLHAQRRMTPADLGFEKEAKLYFDVTPGLDIRFALIFLDAKRRKLGNLIAVGNRNYTAEIPEGTQTIQMSLRIAGSGTCTVNRVLLDNVSVKAGTLLGRSDSLVVANHYPGYSDLYRYAFLHRRVVEYRRLGRLVDVFRFNAQRAGGYYEFNGIDVICGYEDELERALSSDRYRTVLVHLLEPDAWEVLRRHIDHTRVIVWLHGSEVQPWHRREYNFTTEEQRRQAIQASDRRMAFWREIFDRVHPNLHFVFVSQYFADEVMEDVGIRLPERNYTIIHNVIDTELFAYHPKTADQRTKILSIRPYTSRKYANDLTAKAIFDLSKEPFFEELEFRLIGEGPLFEGTVAPLRQFPNVTIERGYLRQEEIAALHREYGVLLTPTRMDAQGVSRDEAMSSGLVPITNRVAAVPEFVDEECGMLVDAEDHVGLARAMAKLHQDPDLFLRLSKAAADRVRRQSGREQTIARELKLIR